MTSEQQKHVTTIAAQIVTGLIAPKVVSRHLSKLTGRSVTYGQAWRCISLVGWGAYYAGRSARNGWESSAKLVEATEKLSAANKEGKR